MFTLLKKEINTFLSSLIGYVVIIIFLLINGLALWVIHSAYNIPDYGYASMGSMFALAPWVFLILIPAITMRLFADEKKSGTIELLLTKPLTDLQIILAKYFAGLILVIFSLLPTLIYFYSIYQLGADKGNIDMGGMWGSYIGLLFLGAAFTGIGVFSSSVTENQIISFLIAIFLCGFTYQGFDAISSLQLFGNIDLFIKLMGIDAHYASISRGVIDSRDVIYFSSVIIFFISLTRFSLGSRKW